MTDIEISEFESPSESYTITEEEQEQNQELIQELWDDYLTESQ